MSGGLFGWLTFSDGSCCLMVPGGSCFWWLSRAEVLFWVGSPGGSWLAASGEVLVSGRGAVVVWGRRGTLFLYIHTYTLVHTRGQGSQELEVIFNTLRLSFKHPWMKYLASSEILTHNAPY